MRCRAPAGPGRSPPGGPCAPLEAVQRVPLTAGCRPACHWPPAGGPPGPRGVPQNCLACVSRPLCPPRLSTAPPQAWRARVIGPRARREQCEALGWLALRPAWSAVCPGDKPGPLTCSPGLQGRPSRVAPAAPVVTRPGSWELGARSAGSCVALAQAGLRGPPEGSPKPGLGWPEVCPWLPPAHRVQQPWRPVALRGRPSRAARRAQAHRPTGPPAASLCLPARAARGNPPALSLTESPAPFAELADDEQLCDGVTASGKARRRRCLPRSPTRAWRPPCRPR